MMRGIGSCGGWGFCGCLNWDYWDLWDYVDGCLGWLVRVEMGMSS